MAPQTDYQLSLSTPEGERLPSRKIEEVCEFVLASPGFEGLRETADFREGGLSGWDKCWEPDDDLLPLSRRFPDVLFTLRGQNEEDEAPFKIYYLDGGLQHTLAELRFEPFDPAKLAPAPANSLERQDRQGGTTVDETHAGSLNQTQGNPGEAGESPGDEAAMIETMRRYRAAKADHEHRKEHAAEYLRQVKAEIEQELRAGEERLARMRTSMLAFVTECNGGRKFSVPGLGVATTTTRTHVEIADEACFLYALPEGEREALFDRKLNLSRAKAAARLAVEEDGEELPGVAAERVTLLSVRLTSA